MAAVELVEAIFKPLRRGFCAIREKDFYRALNRVIAFSHL